ncbi:MAG TPA: LuxR C-terminal-related transcriptional regulator [Polyangiaceae bacterium]|nr:LuxR C-terminal-related transcriptional regulator [Polyangiaceae bacterium]
MRATLGTFQSGRDRVTIDSFPLRLVISRRREALVARAPEAPDAVLEPSLSGREQAVLAGVRRGLSNKRIAIELACSEATVSRNVRRALGKLGPNREWLRSEQSAAPPAGRRATRLLTAAERAILIDVLRGCSSAEIAARRRRSIRTVQNQIAGLFGKLGVNSRRELCARIACSPR